MPTTRQHNLYVAIELQGETTIHVKGGLSDYATACGLAAEGGDINGGTDVTLPARPKIGCTDCKHLFDMFWAYRAGDFV